LADTNWALLNISGLKPSIELSEQAAVLTNGQLKVVIEAKGRLHFYRADSDTVLLKEVDFNPRYWSSWPLNREYLSLKHERYRIVVRFLPQQGERFFGLGQHHHGRLDQSGCVLEFRQRNREVIIPFLMSSRGYGFLWNHPGLGRVQLAYNGVQWVAECARQLDYFVTTGNTYAEILSHYVDATGHAPMLPEWAAGFWQSKLRYLTQEEVLEVAREYRRRGLPLRGVIIDYHHWKGMGTYEFDPEFWPDPSAMVRELRAAGITPMISVWPTINPKAPDTEKWFRRHWVVRTDRGEYGLHRFPDRCGTDGAMHYYDPTHPEARAYLWERLRHGYYRHGFRAFWLDSCEPVFQPDHTDNVRLHLGDAEELLNIYPFFHQQAIFEGLRSEGESEIFMLSRSAWAGSQRFGAAVWSGDIESSFDWLRRSIPAGLNIQMSGIAWWTTDIGGFNGGNPNDSKFRELLIRWFQFGTFCPLFRLHGSRVPYRHDPRFAIASGAPNEVWSFGEEAYQIIRNLLFMRERLMPYILDAMREVSRSGTPVMRPLFFDYPSDAGTYEVADAFLFGPDLLVAPIVTENARHRLVYLPEGAEWEDAFSGRVEIGGRWVTVEAPLDRFGLFVRQGPNSDWLLRRIRGD